MVNGIFIIVLIVWMIVLEIWYHKVFTVYYFSLGKGMLKELGTVFFLGLIMTGLTFYLWWLTAVIIIFTGLILKNKISNNIPLIVAIVLAVLVGILGISMKSDSDGSTTEASIIVEVCRWSYMLE